MTNASDSVIAQWPSRGRSQWQNSPSNLEKNQIHLHLVKLDDIAQERLEHWATTQSLARANKIKSLENRTRYLGGHVGLRQLLCQYSGLNNSQLNIVYGTRGKPMLQNPLPQGQLCFNYTLSKNYALYSFAWNRELGVDIELFPRKINTTLMAKRILSKQEFALWSSLADEDKHPALLLVWTRKEAYGKLLGVGIRYFMHQVSLMHRIDQAKWATEVTGLLEDHHPLENNLLCGVQLKLPIAGAACLMFDSNTTNQDKLNAVSCAACTSVELLTYRATLAQQLT